MTIMSNNGTATDPTGVFLERVSFLLDFFEQYLIAHRHFDFMM